MRIQEAAQAVGCTQRAIKFYEEKGLLPHVARGENGYRDYTDEDIRLLHEIQAYRKLGICLADIRALLKERDFTLLKQILEDKRRKAAEHQHEIDALEAYLTTLDCKAFDEMIDYSSLSQAMRDQLPGIFGRYLAAHFAPYLQIRMVTDEQRDAYRRILAFWDDPHLRLPLLFRFSMFCLSLLPAGAISAEQIDAQIQSMLHPTEEAYAKIREQTRRTVLARRNSLVRYAPGEIMKRQMMRRLKDCGYYDVFIPQMKRLSPSYRAYQDALTALNDRLCQDLGLHYDSNYNLVM